MKKPVKAVVGGVVGVLAGWAIGRAIDGAGPNRPVLFGRGPQVWVPAIGLPVGAFIGWTF